MDDTLGEYTGTAGRLFEGFAASSVTAGEKGYLPRIGRASSLQQDRAEVCLGRHGLALARASREMSRHVMDPRSSFRTWRVYCLRQGRLWYQGLCHLEILLASRQPPPTACIGASFSQCHGIGELRIESTTWGVGERPVGHLADALRSLQA